LIRFTRDGTGHVARRRQEISDHSVRYHFEIEVDQGLKIYPEDGGQPKQYVAFAASLCKRPDTSYG